MQLGQSFKRRHREDFLQSAGLGEEPLPFSTENGSDFSIQASTQQTSAIRSKSKGRKRAAKNGQEATFEA